MAKEERLEQGMLIEKMPKNQKVHNAGMRYIRARDARIAAGREEKELQLNLIMKMKEAGLEHYEYGDLELDIDAKEKVKAVCKSHDPEANGEAKEE